MQTAVVIPALNEAATIGAVIDSVKPKVDWVVLVDDASSDGTGDIARSKGAQVVRHPSNQGYDRSIEDGFAHAIGLGADIVVTFDADGQHLAENVATVTEPIRKGEADLVVGRRPYAARIGEKIFSVTARLKAGIDDPLCGLKAYRTEIYRKIGFFDRIGSVGTELMFRAKRGGFRLAQRDILLRDRAEGDTPRFGRRLKANWKILKAVAKTLFL